MIKVLMETKNTIEIAMPSGVILLKEAISIARARFNQYLPYYTFMYVGGFMYALLDRGEEPQLFSLPVLVLLYLISAGFMLYGSVGFIFNLADPSLHGAEVFNRTHKKVVQYFGLNILTGFITGLGFLLFIIPGIIFSLWFLLAPFIILIENTSVKEAIMRSTAYMKGEFWQVVKRLLVVNVLPLILFYIIAFVLIAVTDSFNSSNADTVKLIYTGIFMVFAVILYVIQTVSLYHIYSFLRKKKPQIATEFAASTPVKP